MKNFSLIFTSSALGAMFVVMMLSFTNSTNNNNNAAPLAPKSDIIYEYRLFSTIESLVPGGLGRSRMITTDNKGQEQENDLENFFSFVGINFKNIRQNDQTITTKINEWSRDGWELYQVVAGVQAHGKDATGLYLTRYFFRRVQQ